MVIHIDTSKVTKFVLRHKAAFAVAGIAILVNFKQAKRIKSLDSFVTSRGLYEEYYQTQR